MDLEKKMQYSKRTDGVENGKKECREQMLINAWALTASGVLAYCFLPLVATLLEQHFPSEQKYDNSNSMWRSDGQVSI